MYNNSKFAKSLGAFYKKIKNMQDLVLLSLGTKGISYRPVNVSLGSSAAGSSVSTSSGVSSVSGGTSTASSDASPGVLFDSTSGSTSGSSSGSSSSSDSDSSSAIGILIIRQDIWLNVSLHSAQALF